MAGLVAAIFVLALICFNILRGRPLAGASG
jgi:hypothetical protein